MKIGIIPNSEDFSRPSDRRKFVRYCEIRKLKFEKAQFTIYGKNQYYGWHHDQFENPHNYPQYPDMNGKIRKLSMSILLNDPKEYEGGVLEFDTPNGIFKCKELIQKGSLVIFPSFIKHRVTPITKGKRLSLVSWTLGYPYR